MSRATVSAKFSKSGELKRIGATAFSLKFGAHSYICVTGVVCTGFIANPLCHSKAIFEICWFGPEGDRRLEFDGLFDFLRYSRIVLLSLCSTDIWLC